MSERTDERTSESGSEDVDIDELLDDDLGGGVSDGGDADGDIDGPSGSSDVGLGEDELGVDVDALTGEPERSSGSSASAESSSASGSESSLLGRLTPSLGVPDVGGMIPSGRSVLLSFGVVLLSMFLFGAIPLFGAVPGVGFLGMFAGAFALGVVSGESRYFELALAAATVGAAAFASGYVRIALIADASLVPFAALGGGIGLVAALLGHYFGRDLREGLTGDLPDS